MCGITRPEDAVTAVAHGVSALGLLFWSGSSRFVSIEQAREICAAVPPLTPVVGLFVDATEAEVEQVLAEVPINLLQMHGDETPSFCEQWQLPYIKALKALPGVNLLDQAAAFPRARGFLLDAVHNGQFGGTGQAFDWSLVPPEFDRPLVLAGGLNPATVGEAISRIRPAAVDVSSGVEVSPGVKDPEKIRQFMKAVQAAEEVIAT
jgi:phosphoribosylanthranilate isomerase